MERANNKKVMEHLSNVEAMIDYYEHAMKGGNCAFRSAQRVLDMLMNECRASLYDALEATESNGQLAELRAVSSRVSA